MSQVIPEEIKHLDFELFEDDKPKEQLGHFAHPTMNGFRWCGAKSSRTGYMAFNGKGTSASVDCPECARLLAAFGHNWWWETHRKHYRTNCCSRNGVIYHECV